MAVANRGAGAPKLVFVTTSLGTKWESYSQALIQRGFPAHKRIVLDGTMSWSPLGFLGPALKEDSDFTVHVDEDCFLYDPDQLNMLISQMEEDDDVVLAGTPDGGHYYRDHNPYACNLFFVVFKTEPIRKMIESNPEWTSYRFKDTFKTVVDFDIGSLDQSRVQHDNFEPYYGFFWMIFENKKKITYLKSEVNPKFLSTDIFITNSPMPLARHMWYLRWWNLSESGHHDNVSNRERYLAVEQDILSSFRHEESFGRILRSNHLARLGKGALRNVPRLMERVARKVLP